MSYGERARVVVIGGGMAGARFARQLCAADGGADVTVVGEEPHAPYNRVLLAEVLAGRYEPDVVALPASPARWTSGVRAVRIDRAERRVVCDDGSLLPYDTLVLATGANPVLPPLRGLFTSRGTSRGISRGTSPDAELPGGVRALRTMDDCLALRGEARQQVPAVVVGGGLLGVSAARALARRGAHVVLAHQGERLMERQLDVGSARLLRRHLEGLGVEVHTECRVRGLCTQPYGTGGTAVRGSAVSGGGDARTAHPDRTAPATRKLGTASTDRSPSADRADRSDRFVRAVELADGYRLAARLVVLACGVRPRTGLARAAGLDVARGVVVDDELRTSDPHVYAIGDCAEHDGVLYGLAGPAQEQADALARVLTAAPGSPGTPRYRGTRALTRLTLAGSAAQPGTRGGAGTREPAPPVPAPAPAPASAPAPTSAPAQAPALASAPQLPIDLAAFGDPLPRPDDDVVHLTDATRGVYRKVVVRGDRLVGGILLGDLTTVGTLARAWEGDEPLPPEPLLHLLTHDGEAPR